MNLDLLAEDTPITPAGMADIVADLAALYGRIHRQLIAATDERPYVSVSATWSPHLAGDTCTLTYSTPDGEDEQTDDR